MGRGAYHCVSAGFCWSYLINIRGLLQNIVVVKKALVERPKHEGASEWRSQGGVLFSSRARLAAAEIWLAETSFHIG